MKDASNSLDLRVRARVGQMVVLEAKDFYLAKKDEIWIAESVLRYRLSCLFRGSYKM